MPALLLRIDLLILRKKFKTTEMNTVRLRKLKINEKILLVYDSISIKNV